jgi:hypothetical protein
MQEVGIIYGVVAAWFSNYRVFLNIIYVFTALLFTATVR